jgi:hypothetical protein
MATAPTHPAQVTVSVSKPAPAPAAAPSGPGSGIAAPPPVDVTGDLASLDSNLRTLTGFGLAHWLAQLLSERYGIPADQLLPPASPTA